ncbi:MAG: protein phosphatase 2C domain-containing protein [Parcubacteria group bacterium]|nr:protein phosphatase 2C domain-containing protein [Parcubacteria group bacterium]
MAIFFTDHYFHIGQSHLKSGKPCQDYGASGVFLNTAYAAISDGCSSGGQTDIGARIITLATVSALKEYSTKPNSILVPEDLAFPVHGIKTEQHRILSSAQGLFSLTDRDLLATSLFASVGKHRSIIHIEGDGVVAIQKKDGTLHLFRFEWPLNMPFYPIYRGESLEQFVEAHGKELSSPCFIEERWILRPDNSSDGPLFFNHTLAEGISGITLSSLSNSDMFEDAAYFVLFTDGITHIEGADWKEAVAVFLKFKNVAGEFLKRRMIHGTKELERSGCRIIDDIAGAIIRVAKEKDEGGVECLSENA